MVTPDEIDRFEVITYVNPTTSSSWIGTAASTASGGANLTFGYTSKILDYPRNVKVTWSGGSGTVISGTVTVVGKNQFNVAGTEVLAALGTQYATVTGTAIYSQVTSVTARQGTAAADIGTCSLGVAILGTTAKLGLPFKLGGTTDVSHLAFATNGAQAAINGGTIGAFVDATRHSILAPNTVQGTWSLTVWAKPTYSAENDAKAMTGLTLLT